MAASDELRTALADLTGESDYRISFDPYWVRVPPYRVALTKGGKTEAVLAAKNDLDTATVYEIRIVCPRGVRVDPSVATLRVQPGELKRLPLTFTTTGDARAGLTLAAIDITQDGVRRGQLFDVILDVSPTGQSPRDSSTR
ncbi:MAG: hypothetical protein NTY17_03005 [Planctomycetia bacterium]|nr:hypothetical protein [Planctomycetia bacterium]